MRAASFLSGDPKSLLSPAGSMAPAQAAPAPAWAHYSAPLLSAMCWQQLYFCFASWSLHLGSGWDHSVAMRPYPTAPSPSTGTAIVSWKAVSLPKQKSPELDKSFWHQPRSKGSWTWTFSPATLFGTCSALLTSHQKALQQRASSPQHTLKRPSQYTLGHIKRLAELESCRALLRCLSLKINKQQCRKGCNTAYGLHSQCTGWFPRRKISTVIPLYLYNYMHQRWEALHPAHWDACTSLSHNSQ